MKALRIFLAALLAFAPIVAQAGVTQNQIPKGNAAVQYIQLVDGTYVPVSATNPMPASGTFSATLAGFTPNGNVASLSVTASSGNVALPAGTVALVTNTGTTNTAFIKLSVGAGSAATTDMALLAGATVGLTVGSNTFINAITASSTTTLRIAGGAGLVSGYGGGGSAGGGGAVTIADGAAATIGTTTDAKSTATDTTGITAMQVLKQISASVQAPPTQAVTIATAPVLVAGSAIIGKVGIDQTTPGTTNLVQVTDGAGALNVIVDSSASVAVTNAGTFAVQPAGSVAHDAVGTGVNPVLDGCYASAAAPTDVSADGDAVRSWCLRNGARAVYVSNNGSAQGAAISGQTPSTIACQSLTSGPSVYTTATTNPVNCNEYGAIVTHPYALTDRQVQGTTSSMTGTTSTSLVAAPASGLRNYITTLSCVNSHATVGTNVTIQDGSGGTAIWTVAAAAVFGGTAITFPVPLKQPTTATALYVANVTTGAAVICSAAGYKAP